MTKPAKGVTQRHLTWRSKFDDAGVRLLPCAEAQLAPHDEAALLMPGDTAKLLFGLRDPEPDGPLGERMWVYVTQRGSDGHYAGLLVNEPYLVGLTPGDEIFFGPHHVLDVWHEFQHAPGVPA